MKTIALLRDAKWLEYFLPTDEPETAVTQMSHLLDDLWWAFDLKVGANLQEKVAVLRVNLIVIDLLMYLSFSMLHSIKQ